MLILATLLLDLVDTSDEPVVGSGSFRLVCQSQQ